MFAVIIVDRLVSKAHSKFIRRPSEPHPQETYVQSVSPAESPNPWLQIMHAAKRAGLLRSLSRPPSSSPRPTTTCCHLASAGPTRRQWRPFRLPSFRDAPETFLGHGLLPLPALHLPIFRSFKLPPCLCSVLCERTPSQSCPPLARVKYGMRCGDSDSALFASTLGRYTMLTGCRLRSSIRKPPIVAVSSVRAKLLLAPPEWPVQGADGRCYLIKAPAATSIPVINLPAVLIVPAFFAQSIAAWLGYPPSWSDCGNCSLASHDIKHSVVPIQFPSLPPPSPLCAGRPLPFGPIYILFFGLTPNLYLSLLPPTTPLSLKQTFPLLHYEGLYCCRARRTGLRGRLRRC